MVEPVSLLIELSKSQNTLAHLAITLAILVIGYFSVNLVKSLSEKWWIANKDVNKKSQSIRRERLSLGSNILKGGVVTAALFYLNTNFTTQALEQAQAQLPKLMTFILGGILGIISIRIATQIAKKSLQKKEVKDFIRDAGFSISSIQLLLGAFKGFLYILLFQILVSWMEIGETFITEIINASSWAIAFLIAALIFYGFKDLFRNLAAGVYLKNSRMVRPGEEVKMDDEKGEIDEVSLFSTTVNTESGYTVLTPNSKISENNLKFRRTKSDLETLEEISEYFNIENKDFSAPVNLEIALEILGYRKSQDKIQKKIENQEEGEEHEKMEQTVAELTNHELNTAWIEHDKVSRIGEELKAWFNDGGIAIIKMRKDAEDEPSYALAVAVEDSDILLLDPSRKGVRYVSEEKLQHSIETEGGGYLVIAPENTISSWRIRNDLIYSEPGEYDELSKTLESRLRKIIRQGRIIEDIAPEPVKLYLEDWRSEEASTDLWKSKRGEDDEQASKDN